MSYSVAPTKKKFPPLSLPTSSSSSSISSNASSSSAASLSSKPKLTLAPIIPQISNEQPTPHDRTIRSTSMQQSDSAQESLKRMQQLQKAIHGVDLDDAELHTPSSSSNSSTPSPFEAPSTSTHGGLKGPSPVPRRSSASEGVHWSADDFEDLGRLGEGSAGEVRKVRLKATGQVLAKKAMATSPNPDIHKQILRELAFNRDCRAPFIVKYHGAFLEEGDSQISIVMEYCEGGSLDSIYKQIKKRNGRTGEKVLGKVAEAVLKGLVYLHDRKIIHRDIKPSNILVSRSGQIKLADFGVSGELINSLAKTFVGTSYYMAPERIQGAPYTWTSDIWSLGLTIHEIAMNKFPFPPEGEPPLGPIDLLHYIIKMTPPELKDDPAGGVEFKKAIRDFLRLCLEKDPKNRPTPLQMLKHPWVVKSEAREVDMAKWVAQIWNWPVEKVA